jgi:uncharacterized OB-fold protein
VSTETDNETEKKIRLLSMFSGEAEQPFDWSVGKWGSKFLSELRDNEQFYGVRCPKCKKVYVPPRQVCGICFEAMDELVEVSDEGIINTFTVVMFTFVDPETGLRRPVPYGYGSIRLDGAGTDFLHFLDENDPEKIKIGMRVKAVFEEPEKRRGSLLDVKHFKVIAEG